MSMDRGLYLRITNEIQKFNEATHKGCIIQNAMGWFDIMDHDRCFLTTEDTIPAAVAWIDNYKRGEQ